MREKRRNREREADFSQKLLIFALSENRWRAREREREGIKRRILGRIKRRKFANFKFDDKYEF